VIACGGAFASGVPPLLLGLPGDNTFSNYTEANRAWNASRVLMFVWGLPLEQQTRITVLR
jgi:phage portal protein BeeE